MSGPELQKTKQSSPCQTQGRLFLDEWIREDIISRASTPANAKKLQNLPLRQIIYYCIARRMALTLEHAMRNSLHYSRKLAEQPGREAISKTIDELAKTSRLCLDPLNSRAFGLIEVTIENAMSILPYTWPEELAKDPESFLALSHSDVDGVISQSSSGTTAQPNRQCKRIFCSKGDLESTIGFFASGMRYMIDPAAGDSVALLLSAGGRGDGSLSGLFTEAMSRIGVKCLVPSNIHDECATLFELAEFRPSCVIAAPRQIISLFRASSGLDCPDAEKSIARILPGLKNVLLSGDRVSSPVTKILSRELGADIFLHYGMVESGLGTAMECGCRNGCHYRESDFFIEIITDDGVSYPCALPAREAVYIDPDNLETGHLYGPTPWGEVTVTSLSREASPLIRYRTGDSGRIIVDKCACGSTLWRLEVRGRMGDYIELPSLPDGKMVTPPHITHGSFDQTIYALPWAKDYQVTLYADNNGKTRHIGITALVNAHAPADDMEAALALRKALAQIETRASLHGAALFINIMRNRNDFNKLFAHNQKRSFVRSASPLNPERYIL